MLFLDTTEERNGLIDHVYPRLREYCLTKYKIQFQVIVFSLNITFYSLLKIIVFGYALGYSIECIQYSWHS